MRWWWISVGIAAACGGVTVVEDGAGGDGASGEGASSTATTSTNAPFVCEGQSESGCIEEASCSALYDWSGVIENAPPPPTGLPLEPEPCCPGCRETSCLVCHTKTYKRCIPRDECDAPQPPEDCGYPESCP